MTTTAITPDILALCAAIDCGVTCLSQLADALEEAGDPRAVGVRQIGYRRPAQAGMRKLWGWLNGYGHAHTISGDLAEKLDKQAAVCRWGDWRLIGSRSAAFLALAVAQG